MPIGNLKPYHLVGNPTGSSNLPTDMDGGQIAGVTTAIDATAGNIGEFVSAMGGPGTVSTTISLTQGVGGVAVVNWTTHGLSAGAAVNFTVSGTGTLPAGITATVNYWVCGNVNNPIATNSFDLASNSLNAILGTCDVTITATGTATQLGRPWAKLANGVAVDAIATSISAGDWNCNANLDFDGNLVGLTITVANIGINTTSAVLPTDGVGTARWVGTAVTAAPNLNTGNIRVVSSTGITLFGVVQASFAGSSPGGYGRITCRRAR
jgi:hypothetical protein